MLLTEKQDVFKLFQFDSLTLFLSLCLSLPLFLSVPFPTTPPSFFLPYSHPLSLQTLIRGRKATQNAEHEEKEVCILPAFYLETKMYITKITTSVILASTYQTELLFP